MINVPGWGFDVIARARTDIQIVAIQTAGFKVHKKVNWSVTRISLANPSINEGILGVRAWRTYAVRVQACKGLCSKVSFR